MYLWVLSGCFALIRETNAPLRQAQDGGRTGGVMLNDRDVPYSVLLAHIK